MPNFCTSLVLQAARDSGQPSALVQAAANGYAAQLRQMPPERAAAAVMMELPIVAQAYGGRREIDESVYKECVKLILSKFSALGANEIREAYRMKAAGELNMPKGKGEMWGGEFNAQQLGEVLTAYMESRRKALGAYIRAQQEQAESATRQARVEKMRREFEKNFPRRIEQIQNAADWREVPEYVFDAARRRGLIRFEHGEAEAILDDARELARLEAQNEYEEAREGGASVFRLLSLRKMTEDEAGLEARAKVIARKISLFRKLKNYNP